MRKIALALIPVLAVASPATLIVPVPAALAQEAAQPLEAGDLIISAYRTKAMLPGQPAGGGFLTITNEGASADRLLAASSPNAGMVEIHTMEVVNDVMTMRPVEGGVEIPAGGTVELKPGGMHLMFMAVTEPFKQGGQVPLSLEFERAGKVELTLPVVGLGG
jgi:hypothetical protein